MDILVCASSNDPGNRNNAISRYLFYIGSYMLLRINIFLNHYAGYSTCSGAMKPVFNHEQAYQTLYFKLKEAQVLDSGCHG